MSRSDTTTQTYEAALAQVIADRNAVGDELRDRRRKVLEMEQRQADLTKLGRRLHQQLPAAMQAKFLRDHPWLADGPDPASRQAVIAGIIQIFNQAGARKITTPDVERALEARGIHAGTKRIYNTLNYLAADGRLERVERGLYRATAKLTAQKSEVA